MVGVLVIGFVATLLIRPVAERHHDAKAAAQMKESDAGLASHETTTALPGRFRLVASWTIVVVLLG